MNLENTLKRTSFLHCLFCKRKDFVSMRIIKHKHRPHSDTICDRLILADIIARTIVSFNAKTVSRKARSRNQTNRSKRGKGKGRVK